MGMGPPETRKVGDAGLLGMRPEIPLPSDASSTLFVEGLPSDCSRREVSHIFRPFVGYKEVRLVPKGSRHSSGDPFMLCFVEFESPAEAATAKDALKAIDIFNLKETDEIISMLNGGVNQDSLDTTQSERPTLEVIIKEVEKALYFQMS